jgi:hypothetical protein
MKDICAQCTACSFMPEQKRSRILSYPNPLAPFSEEGSLVLIVDSNVGDSVTLSVGLRNAARIVGEIPFTYTTAIRCEEWSSVLVPSQIEAALSHCSVWTNFLASERSVILATPDAMQQLHLPTKYHEPGVLFQSKRLGLMLCIMPLWIATEKEIKEYQTKTSRLFKKAGLA